MLGGVGENQLTPVAPRFTAPPNPPELVDASVIERLSKAMNTAKLSAGNTQTIFETLMIASTPPQAINQPTRRALEAAEGCRSKKNDQQ